MAQEKKLMDLWGWDYNDPGIVSRLAACTDQFAFQHARHGGGKAFGLALAEFMIRRAGEAGLYVPRWFSLTGEERKRFQKGEWIEKARWHGDKFTTYNATGEHRDTARQDPYHRYIVRSSAPSEDWADSNSGTNESRVVLAQHLAEELGHQRWENQQPVVVQNHVHGVGCVIDIAHSPLLGCLVGRVSAGRYFVESGQLRATSGTWDHQGPTGVWNILTKERLAWSGGWGETGKFVQTFDYVELLHRLTRCLLTLPFLVGMQLEVIISPTSPHVVAVVQVRPTPGLARGDEQLPDTAFEPIGTAFAVSGKVSGPSAPVTAGVQTFWSRHTSPESRVVSHVANNVNYYGERGHPLPEKTFDKKIVVWRDLPEPYCPVNDLWAVGQLGAVAQIGMALRTNSVHGTPGTRDIALMSEALWQSARRRCLFITLEPEHIRALSDRAYQNPGLKVTVVSDGLVGKVFLHE